MCTSNSSFSDYEIEIKLKGVCLFGRFLHNYSLNDYEKTLRKQSVLTSSIIN